MRIKYNIVKKNKYKECINTSINSSYNIRKKIDKDSLGIIKLYDNELINKVIKKKLDAKFKYILETMIKIEEDDSDPSEGLMMCLNEIDRLNKEQINKYRRFMDKKKQELIEKKVMLLESEIKMKLFNMQIIKNPIIMNNGNHRNDYEEEEKESTRRR